MYHQKPLIGIKDRLETDSYEKEERMHYVMNLVAEKVTFLYQATFNKDKPEEKAKTQKNSKKAV